MHVKSDRTKYKYDNNRKKESSKDLEKAAKRQLLNDNFNVVKKQKLNMEKLPNDLDADTANLLFKANTSLD